MQRLASNLKNILKNVYNTWRAIKDLNRLVSLQQVAFKKVVDRVTVSEQKCLKDVHNKNKMLNLAKDSINDDV